eukprot:scaffold18684_cov121-Isochrysis_galbana.AAC.2
MYEKLVAVDGKIAERLSIHLQVGELLPAVGDHVKWAARHTPPAGQIQNQPLGPDSLHHFRKPLTIEMTVTEDI